MTNTSQAELPSVALTMGDVAGIGPEVVARCCLDEQLQAMCQMVVVGHPAVLERAARVIGQSLAVETVRSIDEIAGDNSGGGHSAQRVVCWNPLGDEVLDVPPGKIDARAGRAAYEYLVAAAHAALAGKIDAITTAPLNKAALRAGGLNYPGHTEILAEVCGVEAFAMMLYLPHDDVVQSPCGLGVAHVTLHTSLASVPGLLTSQAVQETAVLISHFMNSVGCAEPRVAICALNPHAGEQGLFGNEEATVIAPGVEAACQQGVHAVGPLPADTLIRRAVSGEFDAIVAMYHDQGHIAFKLIGFDRAVNITVGLPIVRTSPSHGTAFDIAWQGKADATGMMGAVRVACQLALARRQGDFAL